MPSICVIACLAAGVGEIENGAGSCGVELYWDELCGQSEERRAEDVEDSASSFVVPEAYCKLVETYCELFDCVSPTSSDVDVDGFWSGSGII